MKENHEIRTWKEQSVQLWEKMVTLYVALEKKPSVRLNIINLRKKWKGICSQVPFIVLKYRQGCI